VIDPGVRLPGAVLLVIALALAGCASPFATDQPREPDDDRRIAAEVKAALTEALGVAAAAIHVDAAEGVVTLEGFTGTEEERRRALATARELARVRGVVDRIEVKTAAPRPRE
jgi:osmotically-inducible protein OsmY